MTSRSEAGDAPGRVFDEEIEWGEPEALASRDNPLNAPAESPTGDLDSVSLYLGDVRRRRRVSADETNRRCREMHLAEAAAAGSGGRNKNAASVVRDKRQEAVEGNLALVVSIAREYRPFGLPFEDLIQEGNIGLLAAVGHFDPERGVPFSRYADLWIRQAICRAITTQTRTIRIPLDVLALRRRMNSVMSDLDQEAHNQSCRSGHYRAPTIEDCAHTIGVSAERLRTTARNVPEVTSIEAPVARTGLPLRESLADRAQEDAMTRAAAGEERSAVQAAIVGLPPRLQQVLRRRYGLDGNGSASFGEIGRELHLCRERVRQLHNEALALLRRKVWTRVTARRAAGTSRSRYPRHHPAVISRSA